MTTEPVAVVVNMNCFTFAIAAMVSIHKTKSHHCLGSPMFKSLATRNMSLANNWRLLCIIKIEQIFTSKDGILVAVSCLFGVVSDSRGSVREE